MTKKTVSKAELRRRAAQSAAAKINNTQRTGVIVKQFCSHIINAPDLRLRFPAVCNTEAQGALDASSLVGKQCVYQLKKAFVRVISAVDYILVVTWTVDGAELTSLLPPKSECTLRTTKTVSSTQDPCGVINVKTYDNTQWISEETKKEVKRKVAVEFGCVPAYKIIGTKI